MYLGQSSLDLGELGSGGGTMGGLQYRSPATRHGYFDLSFADAFPKKSLNIFSMSIIFKHKLQKPTTIKLNLHQILLHSA